MTRADKARPAFWLKQFVRIALFGVIAAVIAWAWARQSGSYANVAALVSAGMAIALQRMILAFAGYFVILFGRTFSIGDRITIGGVRGDVVSLGFIQTVVMEMGEPPNEDSGEPKLWVNARQYTGRLARITNDRIFDTPVFNYTRSFPFLWEEMHFPISYESDYKRAESILLEVAQRRTAPIIRDAEPRLEGFIDRFHLPDKASLEPRVYLRMTDNWLEVSLRFIAPVLGVRALKDAITRDILPAFETADLQIASTTFAITGLPPVRVALNTNKPGS